VSQSGGSTTALTLDSSQNATFTGYISAPNTFGFKNRIINGDMRIDQRNIGASVTPGAGQYVVDRFDYILSQVSKFTTQQNAGSVTPPVGFTNYVGMTVGASASVTVGAGDYFGTRTKIEGYNVADLGWGAVNAQTVILSFWVRSSLTGTMGGSAVNDGVATRSYPFTYTINSANTWEYKSITIPGDTSGTWNKTNGIGIEVRFALGGGSTFAGTASAWSNGNLVTATGATNIIATNSATLYITGVQLEKGSQATPFDFRSIGTELQLCQRYCYAITANNSLTVQSFFATGGFTGTAGALIGGTYPVPMRDKPTATLTAALSNYSIYNPNGGAYLTMTSFSLNHVTGPTYFLLNTGFASGGTIGGVGMLAQSASGVNPANYLYFSAEL
jgi:hypothetical protein